MGSHITKLLKHAQPPRDIDEIDVGEVLYWWYQITMRLNNRRADVSILTFSKELLMMTTALGMKSLVAHVPPKPVTRSAVERLALRKKIPRDTVAFGWMQVLVDMVVMFSNEVDPHAVASSDPAFMLALRTLLARVVQFVSDHAVEPKDAAGVRKASMDIPTTLAKKEMPVTEKAVRMDADLHNLIHSLGMNMLMEFEHGLHAHKVSKKDIIPAFVNLCTAMKALSSSPTLSDVTQRCIVGTQVVRMLALNESLMDPARTPEAATKTESQLKTMWDEVSSLL